MKGGFLSEILQHESKYTCYLKQAQENAFFVIMYFWCDSSEICSISNSCRGGSHHHVFLIISAYNQVQQPQLLPVVLTWLNMRSHQYLFRIDSSIVLHHVASKLKATNSSNMAHIKYLATGLLLFRKCAFQDFECINYSLQLGCHTSYVVFLPKRRQNKIKTFYSQTPLVSF